MNLIDTNCVEYIFQQSLECSEDYFMSPDIIEEVELTRAGSNKVLPRKVHSIFDNYLFNESIYIDFYRKMLNKHNGRSFFNMTGFGDISILATIHTIIEVLSEKKQHNLFSETEKSIVIFTEDIKLQKKITNEFLGKSLEYKKYDAIK